MKAPKLDSRDFLRRAITYFNKTLERSDIEAAEFKEALTRILPVRKAFYALPEETKQPFLDILYIADKDFFDQVELAYIKLPADTVDLHYPDGHREITTTNCGPTDQFFAMAINIKYPGNFCMCQTAKEFFE